MSRPTSLRRRLLLALLVMSLLTLSLAGGLSALMDLRLFRDHMLRDLGVLAAVVGESCVSALVFDSRETAEERLATLAGEYQVRSATLYDADGRPFARWQRPSSALPDSSGAPVEIAHPLAFDGQPVGRLVLQASLDELRRQTRSYAAAAVVIALLTLIVALLMAFRLQRRIADPIMALEQAIEAVSEAEDFALRVPQVPIAREIDALAQGFNRLLDQVQRHAAALRGANAALRGMASDLSLSEETEKARLAEELHDGPMQKLALAQMQIEAGASGARQDPTDRAEAEAQLAAGIRLMREAIGELRTLQFELSPPVLHQYGLAAALDWLAADTRARSGIAVTCVIEPGLPVLDRRQSTTLYRCARELVHNMVKHADASHGAIALAVRGGTLELVVSDDGRGFDPAAARAPTVPASGGYGLYSIRERLALLGGDFEIASSPAGSRLTVRLPPPHGGAADGHRAGLSAADGRANA
jgi:signal transduction histidine kinase